MGCSAHGWSWRRRIAAGRKTRETVRSTQGCAPRLFTEPLVTGITSSQLSQFRPEEDVRDMALLPHRLRRVCTERHRDLGQLMTSFSTEYIRGTSRTTIRLRAVTFTCPKKSCKSRDALQRKSFKKDRHAGIPRATGMCHDVVPNFRPSRKILLVT
jgi:hypothetical protein